MYGVCGVDLQLPTRLKLMSLFRLPPYPSNTSWFKNGHLTQWMPVRVWGLCSTLGGKRGLSSPEAARSGTAAALLFLEGEILGLPVGTEEPDTERRENPLKMASLW